MSEIRLKRCPFCGDEAEVKHDNGSFYVQCTHCKAKSIRGDTDVCVASLWNYRKGKKTFREYFDENFSLDKFPQFSESARDSGAICVRVLFGDDAVPCKNMECADCWDMEMQNADLTHGER